MSTAYYSVKFQIGWLPGAIGFTETAKTALASELGVERRIIRGSYAILGASRDPLIKEGVAMRRTLAEIRNQYTIPEYTLAATANPNAAKRAEKVAGSYLIECCRIEEFMSRFADVRELYLAWGRRVGEPENYERIRNADRDALGRDWTVIASKYPTAAELMDAVSCDVPRIEPFNGTLDLETLAPATARLLREQAEERLNASIDGAVAELVYEFSQMTAAVAKNCGKRVRCQPTAEKYSHLRDAEVLSITPHEHDPENVPSGYLLISVQPVQPRFNQSQTEATKFTAKGKPETLLLTPEDYAAELQPYETAENRVLTQTAFSNIEEFAAKITRIKTMFGEQQGVTTLVNLAEQVQHILHDMGGNAAAITKQLRGSEFARKECKRNFAQIAATLTQQQTELREAGKAVRRKIRTSTSEDET